MAVANAMLPEWLGRSATIWASSLPPRSARSPTMSPTLWRRNSSSNRRPSSFRTPSSSRTTEFSSDDPRASPRCPQGIGVRHEPERPRRREIGPERGSGDVEGAVLATDRRVGEVDGRRDPEPLRRNRHVGLSVGTGGRHRVTDRDYPGGVLLLDRLPRARSGSRGRIRPGWAPRDRRGRSGGSTAPVPIRSP